MGFAQHFGTLPKNPEGIVAWVWDLTTCYGEKSLTAGTRREYYERIRFLYRWLRANVPSAEDLPDPEWTPKSYWGKGRMSNREEAL